MRTLKGKYGLFDVTSILLAIILFVSIIPIIFASFYSHPLYDDYYYAKDVYYAISNGGSIWEILSASIQTVKTTYFTWQGTYTAVFLFSLQPASFSEKMYFITTIVMLFSLIASTYLFIQNLLDLLGIEKKYGLILSSIILIISIHFVINKHQAFFWWNGCAYYTLFYSLSLLLFTFLIRMNIATKNSRVVLFIVSIILAFIIGGGNYSTALFSSSALFILICLIFKQNKRLLPFYIIVFIVLILSLTISMLAPGNSVRADQNIGKSATEAVIESFFFSIIYMASWTGLSQIAGFISVAFIALASTKKINFGFKYPLLVLIITTLLYATQLTPPLYALGYRGEGRLVNVYYYSYLIYVSFNVFYFCGWINIKLRMKIDNLNKSLKFSYSICSFVLVVSLFLFGCLKYGVNNLTGINTLNALTHGTPQKYSDEYLDRIDQIKNGNIMISEIETIPDFFGPLIVIDDGDLYFWEKCIAQYYNVDVNS